jgi:hypothetical protein
MREMHSSLSFFPKAGFGTLDKFGTLIFADKR